MVPAGPLQRGQQGALPQVGGYPGLLPKPGTWWDPPQPRALFSGGTSVLITRVRQVGAKCLPRQKVAMRNCCRSTQDACEKRHGPILHLRISFWEWS